MHTDFQHADDLIRMSGSYWQVCALHAAVKLDLLTILDENEMTAVDVAQRIAGDQRGTAMLLDALCAMELLTKDREHYRISRFAHDYLSSHSTDYLGHILMHHHHLVESWSRLDEAVLSGQPVRPRMNQDEAARRESFLMGMFNLAMRNAPRLVPRIDLKGRRRLLDLGGGPGTWAAHFCQHNPELTATVFDLPQSRPFAERTIERFDLADRIKFAAGDFHSDPLEGSYDVVWMSHILHGEGPEECATMVGKAARALESGGALLIHDFILDDQRDAPLFPALFSLNMLLGTPAGQAYSESEIIQMLQSAGLQDIHRVKGLPSIDSGIVAGFCK